MTENYSNSNNINIETQNIHIPFNKRVANTCNKVFAII